ncbi:N-succinylarginine dihydrolase [Aurantiacibacter poecillastricola]|uniref:N-succinylarginine dihydrolase n=1 Tax=Aurantiacibacter poecillastricola TaxID=3064385 RepID=UPI00273EBC20|nr:N-succinylarginine dihydrolase [Aurantiacibacter sp. 219JJ12-13]MDP5262457.1 N-succinylarginine dihydrolase [Aurantiacibacter sp. 219JJ12-13]
MTLVEINFDGIVGPSHNYAGLSLGNLAATRNAGATSYPRAAALQGIAKMKTNMAMGLSQGFLLPLPRPDTAWLEELATDPDTDPALVAGAWSASSMWTANAATVSPAPDTADGKCHLTVANLVTMPHRSHEWRDTLAQLRLAFADDAYFAVHDPVPPCFGDEGAANHMRFAGQHGEPGLEVFVYGRPGGQFPARQHEQASRIVARKHGLDPARVLFVEQNPEAIEAGAFHNDVVAVANETVLFTHQHAFADPRSTYDTIIARCPGVQVVEVPADRVSLEDAITSYLFNAQLLTPPSGEMTLVVPEECRDNPNVWSWLQDMLAGNGPIRHVNVVDVRQSMANGGGPACLRLRVVGDPKTVDPRFMLDEAKAEKLESVVSEYWPEAIDPAQVGSEALAADIREARSKLMEILDITELG